MNKTSPIRNRRKTTAAALATALACLLAASCSGVQKTAAKDEKAPDIPVVAVAKAVIQDMSHALVVTAEFRPYQEIDVMSKVAGYVKSIDVDVGDRVQQGQLLAVLEVPEMADDQTRAQSMLSRSEAEVTHAQDELQRAESAHGIAHLSYTRLADVAKQKAGLVAQQEIDDAQSRDLMAEAQVNAAKSNIATARQQVQVSTSELQRTRTMTDYLRVTAPFAGVVTKRYADTGSMIQAGTSSSTQVMPVVKLSQNSRLRLILPVPESAVPTVHIGQQVEVRVPTLNRSFPGKVARFADKIQQATRTMDTEVDVENANLLLIPGMYAEVNLTLDHRNNVLTIPVTALDSSGESAGAGRVTVVTPDNQIAIQDVVPGLQDASNVEIRSGLHEGDMVVTANRATLHAGEQVRPKLAAVPAATTTP
jgi:RND family efflux transporter MFP subunit